MTIGLFSQFIISFYIMQYIGYMQSPTGNSIIRVAVVSWWIQ